MELGASLKLSFLVFVFAFVPVLSPFIVEARQKHAQHSNNGHHHVRYSPVTPPSLAPASAPDDGIPPVLSPPSPLSSPSPISLSEPPSPSPPTDVDTVEPPPYPYDIGTPAVLPPPGYVYQYVSHGCGYGPCNGANDCDYPCPVCCLNHTCCAVYDDYEEFTYP